MQHPHITRSWQQWEVSGGNHKRVLVIETDLELDSESEGFNSSELDDLIDSALKEFEAKGAVLDRVDIIPRGVR